jgi:histidinol-phosphate aminotransferase
MKIAQRFKNFPAYSPIEPFEVLSARIGKRPEEIIKLDANENPYGPCIAALQALADTRIYHIYPDPESRALRGALQEFTGVPMQYLMAGSGADELIDLILRVLLEPGDTVINCPPTFGMYPFDTRLNAGQVIEIPRNADFSLDIEAIETIVKNNQPKVIFVTSPNNPDGSLLSKADLLYLLTLPLLVVLDEAYLEFTGESAAAWRENSCMDWVQNFNNLVVLRTFSKWAGLAGLRVGFGAFPLWLMSVLWVAKQPYNVNVAASQAAIASLLSLEELIPNVNKLRSERERLWRFLQNIPFINPYPSHANFILCALKDVSGIELKQYLISKGIFIRTYDNPNLRNTIRISVGKPADTVQLISALEEYQ